jgi:hypothetical protein
VIARSEIAKLTAALSIGLATLAIGFAAENTRATHGDRAC